MKDSAQGEIDALDPFGKAKAVASLASNMADIPKVKTIVQKSLKLY